MYLIRDLPAYRRAKHQPNNLEAISLGIDANNNSRFFLCAAYRSPGKCKVTDFIDYFSSAIETMYKVRNELILIGDFNMDMTEDFTTERTADQKLTEFSQRFCFKNQITEATRVTQCN